MDQILLAGDLANFDLIIFLFLESVSIKEIFP